MPVDVQQDTVAYYQSLAAQMANERDQRFEQLRKAEAERDAAMRAVEAAKRAIQSPSADMQDVWNALYVPPAPASLTERGQ